MRERPSKCYIDAVARQARAPKALVQEEYRGMNYDEMVPASSLMQHRREASPTVVEIVASTWHDKEARRSTKLSSGTTSRRSSTYIDGV